MVNLNSKRTEHLLLFFIGILVVIIANQLSSLAFFRIDLTEEKRYTISDATIDMLEDLDSEIFIEVYLEGDLPAGFVRLQKSIRETLEEFKIYAGDNINFTFIDPSVAESEKARNEFYMKLGQKGIQPTRLFDTEDGKKTEKIILPGALISVGGKETGVTLLKGNKSMGSQEALNQSIENVEYELASAIRKLTVKNLKKIAILHGHQELDTLQTASLTNTLREHFRVYHVNLNRRENFSGFDAIIMAKPKEKFSERDVYKIDQFVMQGGKAVFLMDMLAVDMDSAGGEGTVALPVDLGLDDLFFNLGIRFNREYVLDLSSGMYPVVVGNMGDQPQVNLMPWPFFPVLTHYSDHVIAKNSDATYTKFLGTIDTVKAEGVRKTPLIFTSQNTLVASSPVNVSLNELRKDLNPELFNHGTISVAWLYEGSFESLYKNRFLPDESKKSTFIPDGVDTKLIFIPDGDFVKNDFNPQSNQAMELGFDPFTRRTYANADFMVNAMNYLLDENGIINAKKKEIKIRPLDKVKIQEEETFWQVFNLVTPIILIIIFGIIKSIVRKRKFAKN